LVVRMQISCSIVEPIWVENNKVFVSLGLHVECRVPVSRFDVYSRPIRLHNPPVWYGVTTHSGRQTRSTRGCQAWEPKSDRNHLKFCSGDGSSI
jgi:hypothetical protein